MDYPDVRLGRRALIAELEDPGDQSYFTIGAYTQVIIAGVLPERRSRREKVDTVIATRLSSFHRGEREISEEDVRYVLESGKTIESYPDDEPYPSRLVLAWRRARPIHVVVAYNRDQDEIVVINVYEPDLDRWEPGFSERRR